MTASTAWAGEPSSPATENTNCATPASWTRTVTIRSSGRGLRRLTPLRDVDGRPAFSPAGGLIAVTTTTRTRGCTSYESGQVIDRLDLIDPQGHRRRSYVIDSQDCAIASPEDLGTTTWQALSIPTG